MDEDFWKTNDMALVTYLRLCGYSPQQLEWRGRDCYWMFLFSDSLADEADNFAAKKALVEPTEYNRQFGVTKREMYEHKL